MRYKVGAMLTGKRYIWLLCCLKMKEKLVRFLKSLGPGILFASTSIGVSHLVQSTRAGALYGFGLLWAVLAANLFKYPFFEYGSRYANAAGESLIDGYRKMGKWMLWLYFVITLGSMFFVRAAIGAVTAGFMDNLFGLNNLFGDDSLVYSTVGLFVFCIAVLLIGKYKALDHLVKIIGTVLVVSTVVAVLFSVARGPVSQPLPLFSKEVFDMNGAGFVFLIALMGWMPNAIDLSSWHSLWTLERIKETGYKPRLKETLQEFNFGYLVSTLLAPLFLLLGAYMLFGTDYLMPESSAGFASAIIGLYTENIGAWSYLLIAASAFSIMFGTSIAVFDGYSRAMSRIVQLLGKPDEQTKSTDARTYNVILVVLGAGALTLITFFGKSLKTLVDLATSISFLIAPVIAFVNFKLVTSKSFPAEAHPGKGMRWLSYAGLVFLSVFAAVYLWMLLR